MPVCYRHAYKGPDDCAHCVRDELHALRAERDSAIAARDEARKHAAEMEVQRDYWHEQGAGLVDEWEQVICLVGLRNASVLEGLREIIKERDDGATELSRLRAANGELEAKLTRLDPDDTFRGGGGLPSRVRRRLAAEQFAADGKVEKQVDKHMIHVAAPAPQPDSEKLRREELAETMARRADNLTTSWLSGDDDVADHVRALDDVLGKWFALPPSAAADEGDDTKAGGGK